MLVEKVGYINFKIVDKETQQFFYVKNADFLTPLQEKIEAMMVSADSVLTNVNDVFDAQTKANLKNSIAQLSSTINSFKSTSTSLNSLIESDKAICAEGKYSPLAYRLLCTMTGVRSDCL